MISDKNTNVTTNFEKMDLTEVMMRVAKENPELMPDQLKSMESDYRVFLAQASQLPGQALSPSKLVDKVWHSHILFTEKYAKDCKTYAGRFLHHHPLNADGIQGEKAGCSSECGIGAGCVT